MCRLTHRAGRQGGLCSPQGAAAEAETPQGRVGDCWGVGRGAAKLWGQVGGWWAVGMGAETPWGRVGDCWGVGTPQGQVGD